MAAPSPTHTAAQQAHAHSVPRAIFPCLPSSSSSSSSSSSPSNTSSSLPHGMVGNDPLDPGRLTLNNGINNGDFIIGPAIQPVNGTPVRNISEYLAKRDGVDEFVVLKVLKASDESEQGEENTGKVLLYNELSILSLLQDQQGVIHQHGFFRDRNYFILVLDCLVAHEYDKNGLYKHFENLQHYVIREKKLCEREALEVFSSAVSTVTALHKKNIVHRDLKLGNMILNTRTREVTLTNFVLSKHLVRDGEELTDQRGSLAYVSPDVLSGLPYDGKASDMWAMGVLLYTMLYGQFPFYDSDPQELFKKIKTAKYTIPHDGQVSLQTVTLIKEMIELDPRKRVSAQRALEATQSILGRLSSDSSENDLSAQIVPELEGRLSATAFTVPTKNEDTSPTSLSGANVASNLTMQLSISPSLLESHHSLATSPVHLATSPVHPGPISVHGSPVHAAGQHILVTPDLSSAYMFTSLPLAPHPSTANGSPFPSPSTSPPFLNASPTNSMGSAVSSPLNIPGSPSHSVSASLLNCHRPVGPSQSVDSFFTSHSLPSTLLHSTTHFSPQHIHNVVLPSVSESGRSPEIAPNAYNIVSSPGDSFVTMRSPPRPNTGRNRHSYTNGDASSVFNFVPSNSPLHLPLHAPRQRRNSSGSQDVNSARVRRSSHSSVMSPSASLDSAFLASHRRGRRRSHDAYMDRDDIIANFGPLAVSQRRTSRSSSREPYNV